MHPHRVIFDCVRCENTAFFHTTGARAGFQFNPPLLKFMPYSVRWGLRYEMTPQPIAWEQVVLRVRMLLRQGATHRAPCAVVLTAQQ